MGKYNLGENNTGLSDQIIRTHMYLNEKKSNKLVDSIEEQLDDIRKSLLHIQLLLNQSAKTEMVKGKRAEAFKGWAKKSKSQANQVEKLKEKLVKTYQDDVHNYPLQLLDDRIAELEKRIASMSN